MSGSKPTPTALQREIARSFGGAVSMSSRSTRRADALYEHFLLGLVLRAARARGAAVRWCDADDKPTTVVRLRAGPGVMAVSGWTHAELMHGGRDVFEVHAGLMVDGASIAHQADVLVLPSGRGRLCRRRGENPRVGDVELLIEGKRYGTTEVDLALARGLVGLCAEFRWSPVILATSQRPQASAAALLGGWGIGIFGEVSPGSSEARNLVAAIATLL